VEENTAALQRELEELQAQICTLEKNLQERPDYGLGKGAPAVTQWELDQTLLHRLKARAISIERTLQTIEVAYGVCRQCGRMIHPDRLAVLPDATTCIHCARDSERSQIS